MSFNLAAKPLKDVRIDARLQGAVILQPSLCMWSAADGSSQMFHPETPSLAALRATQPNRVDQVRLEKSGHWLQHEAAHEVNAALIGSSPASKSDCSRLAVQNYTARTIEND